MTFREIEACAGTDGFFAVNGNNQQVEQCDLPFRLLVRKYGCDLCYTQMFHSRVMFEDTSYKDKYFQSCKEDRPLVVQVDVSFLFLSIVMR